MPDDFSAAFAPDGAAHSAAPAPQPPAFPFAPLVPSPLRPLLDYLPPPSDRVKQLHNEAVERFVLTPLALLNLGLGAARAKIRAAEAKAQDFLYR